MALRTQELLDRLMMGDEMTITELDDLLANKVAEDLLLDYKHGDKLKEKKASETIRKYVSGFANSAGGVLIIGVDAEVDVWIVTGARAPGGHDLARWARDCLGDMVAHLSPPPR